MDGLKQCFKCAETKPRTEFYRHAQMGDGLLGKCKACAKADAKRDRLAKLDQKRAYDRQRAALPHRIALGKKVQARWKQRHPDRRKAQYAACNALRDGRMERQQACEGCGKEGVRLEKHHPDYGKPLLVMWLCKPCHAFADKIRRIQESA